MAKVKIQGHASGTGILTVTAPNTSTDRTITLPDATGTLLNSDGSGASLTSLPAAQVSGTHTNFTSTGIDDNATSTAITINATENVGIEVTPESWEDNYPALQIGGQGSLGGHSGSEVYVNENVYRNGGAWKHINTAAASQYTGTGGQHKFKISPSGSADAAITWTTAMTIENSGDVLVGTASSFVNQTTRLEVLASATGADALGCKVLGGNDRAISFYQTGYSSPRGHITVGTSSVAYNTSSDYRLKENVVDMENATDRVKQLKPKRFNFIADDTNTLVDGFIAHEVSSVVPEAISGAKDAVDDDGNAVHQGIDQSKLVPLLVKTIQELEARITALES